MFDFYKKKVPHYGNLIAYLFCLFQKMITEIVALREAGLDDTRPSYLEEPTVIVDESMMNDSANLEEREWRKQGLSEKQMFAILEKRKQTQLNNVNFSHKIFSTPNKLYSGQKTSRKGNVRSENLQRVDCLS